ncbi:hypothetical protein GE118_03265 [Mycoplasma sp. NEAQ87857]|uniref:hypothetical protein n=1 Tax=Mycoplasma sp. NEAQ87857 TaxID=2683967 RepID=UPI0013169751|nr:hypothetical protein [Mycoplasma sp. NEAQ87857]QGZ97809.1 hypothetical protein GE118_03265 [Mycoplasma sp. NEAQ87857]
MKFKFLLGALAISTPLVWLISCSKHINKTTLLNQYLAKNSASFAFVSTKPKNDELITKIISETNEKKQDHFSI